MVHYDGESQKDEYNRLQEEARQQRFRDAAAERDAIDRGRIYDGHSRESDSRRARRGNNKPAGSWWSTQARENPVQGGWLGDAYGGSSDGQGGCMGEMLGGSSDPAPQPDGSCLSFSVRVVMRTAARIALVYTGYRVVRKIVT